ncbi:MAG: RidA family protein [Chloroflexi bacterium]|nr:RidA family protein [Chloroflexota bacterium]
MTLAQRLTDLGLELPAPAPPRGLYTPAVRSGNLLYISGQLPGRDGVLLHTGKLGADVTIEQGQDCARQAALNALSIANAALGSLDTVRVVRMSVFVASAPGFNDQPLVANGASQLLLDLFGDNGKHARTALGAAELPANAPVEVELLLEVTA